jgi:hypothetical protein
MSRKRKKHLPTSQTVVRPDVQFERELEVFRTEAEGAAQFFYALLAIHAAAGAKTPIYKLFDQDSAHNIGRLMRLAQDNPQIFSKAEFAQRRQGAAETPPDWLDNYLKDIYLPKPADFRRLRGYVSRYRKIYLEKYQPLRHRVFAHKGASDAGDVSALFASTNIRELQRMLTFLMSLYDAMWQLFVNGKRPVLRPQRYSVGRMRARLAKNARGRSVHERLVHEVERFLEEASVTPPVGSLEKKPRRNRRADKIHRRPAYL